MRNKIKIKYENISKVKLLKGIKERKRKMNPSRKFKFSKKNKSKFKYLKKFLFISFILSLILLIIFFMFKKLLYTNNSKLKHNTNKDNIYHKEKFPSLQESFNNAKNFLKNCLEGIIMNNKSLKYSKNPKVTTIVTVHNCKRTISRTIKSIQNQNLSDIEIILVNDFSTDDTTTIIEDLAKIDPRIKIINNKKTMGTYFSRSIGTLSARGKYIFHLDNDDMLLNK